MHLVEVSDSITAALWGGELRVRIKRNTMRRDRIIPTIIDLYEKASTIREVEKITIHGLKWSNFQNDMRVATMIVPPFRQGAGENHVILYFDATGPNLVQLMEKK